MESLEMLSQPYNNVMTLIDQTIMASSNHNPLEFVANCWTSFRPNTHISTTQNTIIFDDLRRNILTNLLNSVPITPYKDAIEAIQVLQIYNFYCLATYLVSIAALDCVSKVDHRRWKNFRDQ